MELTTKQLFEAVTQGINAHSVQAEFYAVCVVNAVVSKTANVQQACAYLQPARPLRQRPVMEGISTQCSACWAQYSA
jgi:hypothetical protein